MKYRRFVNDSIESSNENNNDYHKIVFKHLSMCNQPKMHITCIHVFSFYWTCFRALVVNKGYIIIYT